MIGTNIIEINNKEYSYSFTMGAFIEFQRATKSKEFPKGKDAGKLLSEFASGEIDYEGLATFVFCALKYGMKREKQKFTLKIDDVIDALSDDTELLTTMFNSITENDLGDEEIDEDVKKK